jgi:hypothetical protein
MLMDRKISLVLMALFAAFYATTFKYKAEIVAFPRFLLWIFLGLSILLFIFPKGHPNYNIKAILAKEKLLAALLLVIYAIVFPRLGFFVTTFIFAVAYMWIFSKKHLKNYVIIAAVYLVIVYIVFQKLLYVWFPQGLFF